ncbi:hypothetical protein RFI_40012 [Reticulomyxa filosa]|uniref:CAP-Gly domain-containing protein n=1 Tax=Reticulomyxa filosa TaxID=46433 RepID=X6L7V0_RETFI|nr:hypothetical protein RFI_40012 [Reticulomyxa filosa]|eukprot:ETN97515.1 hypothetical protein RFI_40012 [Reticulomyxa filosa]
MKAVTVENAEMYLLYASKYAQLLSKKNFAQNVWTHVIVTSYLTSLDDLFRLIQSFQMTHQNDMGTKILQHELFSNRSRMEQLLASLASSFYSLSEASMKFILSSNELNINEEQLFDGVMEWSKRTVDREKALTRDNHKSTNETKSSFESWKEHIRGVLPLIRFPIMDSDYILKNILPNRDMFANSQHLLFILSFHLSRGDATHLKDLPYSAQSRNANPTSTNKNQTREDKLQSENKSLRKTISELTTKLNQLETQVKRSSRPSQSNMFGVDSANTNTKVGSSKARPSIAVAFNKLAIKTENESGKRNSNSPASLSPLPRAGTHRKDNETTIEHPLEDTEHLINSSEDGEDQDKNKQKILKKALSNDSTQEERSHRKEKEELEEEDEEQYPSDKDELDEEDDPSEEEQQKQQEVEKKAPQHWGQLSVATDLVDSMVEGKQGAQFIVGFRKLNNFDEEENEKADKTFEAVKQNMEARLKRSKSKEDDQQANLLCFYFYFVHLYEKNSTNSVGAPASDSAKKPKKVLIDVSTLETPLYKGVLSVGACKYSALEEQKLQELNLEVNDIVTISQDRIGVVRYIGEAHFFWGTVVGLELQKNSKGKNNGHIDGIKYFECKPSKGLFIKPMAIAKAEKPKQKKPAKTPNNSNNNKTTKNPGEKRKSEMITRKDNANLLKSLNKEQDKSVPREWPGKFKQKAEQERMDRLGIDVGDCVQLSKGERAVIMFVGVTNNSKGLVQFGIELLDGALGCCSGEINGERYFECEEKRGEFIYSDRIRKKVEFLSDLPEW